MTDEEIKALVDEFNRKVSLDPEIRSVMQKIRNQDADFSDTSRMFWRRSELLRNYLQGVVLDLPAGAREQLCTVLLNAGYNETNEVMQSVQQAQDEPQGIHLNPVLPKCPAERIHTVAHALEDPTVPDDKIVRRAGAPVANVNMSFHDRYIEENAKIRAKLGMKPTITRYGSGCCSWCSAVAGRYKFGEQPKDIFRRHDNCGCTIIYDNQVLRGHQNEDGGRSRAWEAVDPAQVEKLGFTPTVHTQEQAKRIEQEQTALLWAAAENSKLKSDYPQTIVDRAMLTNPDYRRLYDALGENSKITRQIFQSARDALMHRSGTKFEDLIYIDPTTGKILSRTDYNVESEVIPSKSMKNMVINAKPGTIISIHNHPESAVPSIVDVRTAHDRNYQYGIVACHNGNIFQYRTTGDFDDGFVDSLLDKLHRIVYNTDEEIDAERLQRDLDQTLELLRKNNVDVKVILWQ